MLSKKTVRDLERLEFEVQKEKGSNIPDFETYRKLRHSEVTDIFYREEPVARLKNKIGEPDLMIFFTNCMSHKMVHCALDEIKGMDTRVERVQSASVASLKKILEKYADAA